MTSPASERGARLQRLAGPTGIIAAIALDHRDSLRVMLERRGHGSTDDDDLRAWKLRLTRTLAPAATAVMLDEELGREALDAGAVPPSVGLIMPLEAQGYEAVGDGRTTTLLDDFSPEAALARGATACKLLVPYRADHARSAALQDATVEATAAACHEAGLPLVLEPIPYRWSTETTDTFAAAFPRLAIEAVRRLAPLGPDLLKVPFPSLDKRPDASAAADACHALADACAGRPWVLLGAGVDTTAFLDQIALAGSAGASGFLVGRGIWADALVADLDEAERIASSVCLPAFQRCRSVAERWARPLHLVGPT